MEAGPRSSLPTAGSAPSSLQALFSLCRPHRGAAVTRLRWALRYSTRSPVTWEAISTHAADKDAKAGGRKTGSLSYTLSSHAESFLPSSRGDEEPRAAGGRMGRTCVCVSARLPAGNELESTTGRVCDVIVL